FLTLHIAAAEPTFGPLPYPSLTLGFVLSVAIAGLTVLGALRGLRRVSPRALLAGQWSMESGVSGKLAGNGARGTAGLSFAAAAALAAASFAVPANHAAALFFGSGAALLIGCLALIALWLRRRSRTVQGEGYSALLRLGAHNAARFPGRSLLTV